MAEVVIRSFIRWIFLPILMSSALFFFVVMINLRFVDAPTTTKNATRKNILQPPVEELKSALLANSPWVTGRPCPPLALQDGVELFCFWVKTEEAPGILFPVTVIAATQQTWDTPLVYLPGGPGGSHTTTGESLIYWYNWYAHSPLQRPLVLVDYRYAPPGLPSESCSDYRDFTLSLFSKNLSLQEESELAFQPLQDCFDSVQNNLGSDLTDVNSAQNATDMQRVLHQLGFSQWDIFAASYGTRVALIAALDQPEVRRVILDSPYLLDEGKDSDIAVKWHSAFAALFKRCSLKGSGCEAVTEDNFRAMVKQLNESPVSVSSEYWQTGHKHQWKLNGVRFASFVFTTLYEESAGEILEPIFHSGLQTAWSLHRLEVYFNALFAQEFSEWIYYLTECNDKPFESEEAFEAVLTQLGLVKMFFTGLKKFDVCPNRKLKPSSLPEMRSIEKPVWTISGAHDPITSEAGAIRLHQWLTNGLHWRSSSGHAEFSSHNCAQQLIDAFLDGQITTKNISQITSEGC